jgi:hypothetical protein
MLVGLSVNSINLAVSKQKQIHTLGPSHISVSKQKQNLCFRTLMYIIFQTEFMLRAFRDNFANRNKIHALEPSDIVSKQK